MVDLPPMHVTEFLSDFQNVKRLGLRYIILKRDDNSRELYYVSRLGQIMYAEYTAYMPFPELKRVGFKTFSMLKQYIKEHANEYVQILDSDKTDYGEGRSRY